jgi:hypothetical protein
MAFAQNIEILCTDLADKFLTALVKTLQLRNKF